MRNCTYGSMMHTVVRIISKSLMISKVGDVVFVANEAPTFGSAATDVMVTGEVKKESSSHTLPLLKRKHFFAVGFTPVEN